MQNTAQLLERGLVDEEGEGKRIQRRNRRAFRRSKNAGADAQQDDDDGHQTRQTLERDLDALAKCIALAFWIILLVRNDTSHNQQCCRQQNTGDDTAQEQAAAGNAACRHRINDHVMRRRNNHGLRCGCNGDVDRIIAVIALLFHQRDHRRADGRNIRRRAAGNRTEEGRSQNVDICHAAAETAYEDICEIHELIGYTAAHHNLACEDKKRNCQQAEGLNAGRQSLPDNHDRNFQIQTGQNR